MKIETSNYRDEHGHNPQGREPALWSFDLRRAGAWTTLTAPGPMKLAAAKRWALQEARQIGGTDYIQLAP